MPERGFRAGLMAPGVAVTGGLILFSCLLLAVLSLRVNDGSLLGTGLTTVNFLSVLTDPLYAMVIARSLLIAGLVTLATVVTAYPVAYWLSFRAGDRRGVMLFLVTLPFWTSYLLRVFAWKIVLAFNGVLNSVLLGFGLLDQPATFLNTPAAVVLTLAHAYAPFAILPILVALDTIPRSLTEAAADLGARPFATFTRITLPNSMTGVLAAAIVVFVPTMGDYITPALIGGPASTMIGTLIQAQFGKAQDWPFGSALALIVMLVMLALMAGIRAANRKLAGAA